MNVCLDTNAYSQLEYKKGDFPVTEKIAEKILSLQMFPGLNKKMGLAVVNGINDFLNQ